MVTLTTVLRSSTQGDREVRGTGGLSQVPWFIEFIGSPAGQVRDVKTLC